VKTGVNFKMGICFFIIGENTCYILFCTDVERVRINQQDNRTSKESEVLCMIIPERVPLAQIDMLA
jgi:hypothetical protein